MSALLIHGNPPCTLSPVLTLPDVIRSFPFYCHTTGWQPCFSFPLPSVQGTKSPYWEVLGFRRNLERQNHFWRKLAGKVVWAFVSLFRKLIWSPKSLPALTYDSKTDLTLNLNVLTCGKRVVGQSLPERADQGHAEKREVVRAGARSEGFPALSKRKAGQRAQHLLRGGQSPGQFIKKDRDGSYQWARKDLW